MKNIFFVPNFKYIVLIIFYVFQDKYSVVFPDNMKNYLFKLNSHFSPMCGNQLMTMVPIYETTSQGTLFQFTSTFISTSADGNSTDVGFSLVLVCE